MKLFLSFALLLAFGALQAFPLWFEFNEKDGSFRVEQLKGRLRHFDRKWIGREQSPKTVKGTAVSEKDARHFSGSWKAGPHEFRLEETFRQLPDSRVEYVAELFSAVPVDTAEIALNLTLPLAILKEKSITVDKEAIHYAAAVSKQNNRYFSGVEQISIEMPEGKLVITGPRFRALLQDDRNFVPKNASPAPGSYTLRLYPQQDGGEQFTVASFRYIFEFRGIKSNPVSLAEAANRAFRDEVAGDGKGGWNDQGPENDLRMFQPGRHRFFGVEFQVADPDRNGGRACIVLNGGDRNCFADSATVRPKGKGKFLYLLHANAFTGKYRDAGTILVKFRNGSTQEIAVRNLVDVGNWWGGVDHENAPVVWKSTNAKSVVGLYMTGFQLSRDDPAEITFAKGEYPNWMIVGATLTDRKAEPYRINTDVYILPGPEWTPTQVRDITAGTVLDFSKHAEAPAGKYGRVILSPEGRLVFENAPTKRLRLLGVNICDSANFPDKATAEQFARNMAMAGYNTIRFHHFENGLNNGRGKHSFEFDPERLDRLDYLVHCLKAQGIYITFDLYASRTLRPGEAGWRGDFKTGVCFDEGTLKNWREFSDRLLNHVNPYTGMRWADDPVFFCLNLVNENPLLKIWRSGDQTVILAGYAAWLTANGLDTPKNRERRDGPFLRYLTERQSRTIAAMKEFLRNEVGTKILITDINCDNHPYLSHSRNTLDLVDNHYYHDHPSHPEGGWNPPSVFTQFSSISRYAETPRKLMPTRIFGKPFLVTEYQFCHPNNFIAEAGPLMGAYSALQDWDGLWRFQYSLSDKNLHDSSGWLSYFTMANSPTMRMSEYITWFLFIRGDVRPAPQGIALKLDDSLFEAGSVPPAYSKLGLIHRIGVLPPGAAVKDVIPAGAGLPETNGGEIVSSTGEITLSTAPEFRVVTPKSECITTGEPAGEAGRLSFRNGNTFQTFSVHTLDDRPIGESDSLLFFHLSDVKNSSEKFSGPDMTHLLHYGKTPVLQRIGRADISLRLPAGKWKVEALSQDGTVKKRLETVWSGGVLRFSTDTSEALAYHIFK